MTDEQKTEIWIRMYEEQIRHVRHHEELRTHSTNIIVAISAALIAVMDDGSTHNDIALGGLLIIIINLYGLFMSLKHYERSRLHAAVGSSYREVISEVATIGHHHLDNLRSKAREHHQSNFTISKVRAYYLWFGLHILLIILGLLVIGLDP